MGALGNVGRRWGGGAEAREARTMEANAARGRLQGLTRRSVLGRSAGAAAAAAAGAGLAACAMGVQQPPPSNAAQRALGAQGDLDVWTFPLTSDDTTSIWQPLMATFQ